MPINYEPIISVTDVNDEVWFNIINRTIVPQDKESIVDALVKNDKNSRNFGFHIQRYFEDEDLSTKRIRVHYVNSLGQADISSASSIKVADNVDEVLTFKWIVSKNACLESGEMQFSIEFYNTDETYSLCTKPITINVAEGIDGIRTTEPESEWFSEYSARLNILEDNMNSFNEAVDNGEFDGAYTLNTFANAIAGNKSGAAVRIDDASSLKHTMSVTVKGRNLIAYPYYDTTKVLGGVLFTDNGDGTISVKGTVNNEYEYITFVLQQSMELVDGVTYRLSRGRGMYLAYKDESGKSVYVSNNTSFTWSKNYTFSLLFLQYNKGITVDETIKPILSVGADAVDYVPYINPSEVKLTKCRKNLINYNNIPVKNAMNGVAITRNEDILTFNGTLTSNSSLFNLVFYMYGGINNYYTISYKHIGGTVSGSSTLCVGDSDLPNDVRQGWIALPLGNTDGSKVYQLNKSYIRDVWLYTTKGTVFDNYSIKIQFEQGDKYTGYEPYNGEIYIPNADGTVVGVTSASPTITLMTDAVDVTIDCKYNKDANIVLNDIITRLTNLESKMSSVSGGVS